MIRIKNFRVPLDTDEEALLPLVAKKLRLSPGQIKKMTLARKALDARRKPKIDFVYTIDVEAGLPDEAVLKKCRHDVNLSSYQPEPLPRPRTGTAKLVHSPAVVGAGPAGIFAALTLATYGYRPVVLERGKDVTARTIDVQRFWESGIFDPESNVQFGEGGAGTFSDGKLTSRVNDPRVKAVLELMVEAGAPPEILYINKPHVGTDKLRQVVYNLRQKLLQLGGKIYFTSKVTDLVTEHGVLKGVVVNGQHFLPAEVVVLAIGHSARDTYAMLDKRGIHLEQKPFAIGVRIEHPQRMVDMAQYGELAGHPKLGAADYQLVHQDQETGRAAYTFCMCPGGVVVGAASEPGMVVTNGMSEYRRDSGVANSAIVVAVRPGEDFSGPDPLAGINFQRQWESKAFALGGRNYHAPVQSVGDFFEGRPSNGTGFLTGPSYRPGVVPGDLHQCLPTPVSKAIGNAIRAFGKKLAGFDHPGAVLMGVETRTSAPVRISRDDRLQSLNLKGLYPAGEGAGYAGGIVSASIDGMKVAEAIIRTYDRPLQKTPGWEERKEFVDGETVWN